jgi:DNA-binding NarL/FixJ family response regulator
MTNPETPVPNKNTGPVILIVDDSLPMRMALSDMIGLAYPSFCILQAESGEQALEVARTRPPDLVLMDIVLPGMDGLACLVEIRRLYPETRSVVISYHEEQPYRQKALQAGASAYIAKRRLYLDLMPAIDNLLKTDLDQRITGV